MEQLHHWLAILIGAFLIGCTFGGLLIFLIMGGAEKCTDDIDEWFEKRTKDN